MLLILMLMWRLYKSDPNQQLHLTDSETYKQERNKKTTVEAKVYSLAIIADVVQLEQALTSRAEGVAKKNHPVTQPFEIVFEIHIFVRVCSLFRREHSTLDKPTVC